MLEIFTESSDWSYIIIFSWIIIFLISILLLNKNKFMQYKIIMSYLFLCPLVLGIIGTLAGYHFIINGLRTMHLTHEIIFKAEVQAWYSLYLGLIFSSLLYIFGIFVWFKKKKS